jgi:hypothetical protein
VRITHPASPKDCLSMLFVIEVVYRIKGWGQGLLVGLLSESSIYGISSCNSNIFNNWFIRACK